MSFKESAKSKSREKWPLEFDLEGISRDRAERERRIIQKEFEEQGEQEMPQNHFSNMNDNVFDPSAKVKMPYVHQEYPKMVYSEQFDPAVEKRRREITAHNA